MSKAGPSPCSTRDGRLVGKFNGTVYHFGRASDPESYAAFNRFKGAWEDAGRTVTIEMVEEIGYVPKPEVAAEKVTIQQIRDRYIVGLEERGAEWCRNNLSRYKYALEPLVDLTRQPTDGTAYRFPTLEQARAFRTTLTRRRRS